jgi:type IV pilus assembly protein PilE
MPTATTCAIAPTRDATAACSLAKYDADVLESSCFARKRFGGFTLIELMIVVAVVAILTKIAYPSYLEYMKRGYRSAAQGFMLDLANREQQYLLDNRSFIGGSSAVTTLIPVGVPTEVSAYYTVTITATAGPPPTFEVKASPLSGSILAGETPFTIDQDGTRLPSGKWQGR